MSMIVFVCHPYHRGGVTKWMRDAFLHASRQHIPTAFVTIRPARPFISGQGRPAMANFVGPHPNLYFSEQGRAFELGTPAFRVDAYRRLILQHIPPGAVLIPSDDEACWQACCALAEHYRVLGVLHSDDPVYYRQYNHYHPFLAGVVAVSNRVLAQAGPPAIPARVIPCGIDISQFGASAKQQTIIWVGRLEEGQKRASDIIPIARAMLQQLPGWSLAVYGHGEQLPWLHKKKEELGLNNLELHGWQSTETVSKALSNAAVLLQTSNFEGMSVAVMEALASGCLVVSSRVSGVEDLEQLPQAAGVVFTYAIGQVDEAVQALHKAIACSNESAVHRAQQLAQQQYSIDSCLHTYLRFSEEVQAPAGSMPFGFSLANRLRSHMLALLRSFKFQITSHI